MYVQICLKRAIVIKNKNLKNAQNFTINYSEFSLTPLFVTSFFSTNGLGVAQQTKSSLSISKNENGGEAFGS